MAGTAGTTAASSAAISAAIARAIRASGAIVKLSREEFLKLLQKIESPLIIVGTTGIFSKKHEYLTSYKGFIFYTKCAETIPISGRSEIISADKIWIP